MPGSSLWLVPPPTHPLHAILTTLITDSLPPILLSSSDSEPVIFPPHLTLTSEVLPSTYAPDPQAWLDSISFPKDTRVLFTGLRTEDFFFRRCYLQAEFTGVRDLAGAVRASGVEGEGEGAAGGAGEKTAAWLEWWRTGFGPHVSLAYDGNPIDDAKLDAVNAAVQEAGIKLGDDAPVLGDEGGWGGWEGGVVWLVPTDKPISEWSPIATREI